MCLEQNKSAQTSYTQTRKKNTLPLVVVFEKSQNVTYNQENVIRYIRRRRVGQARMRHFPAATLHPSPSPSPKKKHSSTRPSTQPKIPPPTGRSLSIRCSTRPHLSLINPNLRTVAVHLLLLHRNLDGGYQLTLLIRTHILARNQHHTRHRQAGPHEATARWALLLMREVQPQIHC